MKKISPLNKLKKKLNCSRCKRISTIECYKCGMFTKKPPKEVKKKLPIVKTAKTVKPSRKTIGYFLSVDGKLDMGTRLQTRKRAMELALGILKLMATKAIDIVRANDLIILTTVSRNEKQGFQVANR